MSQREPITVVMFAEDFEMLASAADAEVRRLLTSSRPDWHSQAIALSDAIKRQRAAVFEAKKKDNP